MTRANLKRSQMSISTTFSSSFFARNFYAYIFVLEVHGKVNTFLAQENWWKSCSQNVGEIDYRFLKNGAKRFCNVSITIALYNSSTMKKKFDYNQNNFKSIVLL
jgi:hypothetical protein